MDKRSQIPPSLPRDSPTTSYWQDPPDGSVADLRSTPELPSAADTVIIGSGITGAAVAWGLLGGDEDDGADGGNDGSSASSDSKDIVMLEARQACSGATGRNGSFRIIPFSPCRC